MTHWTIRAQDGRMLSIAAVDTPDGPRVAVNILDPGNGRPPLLFEGERAQEIRNDLGYALAEVLRDETWPSS